MLWVFFSSVPECVVISLLETTFPDTVGAPGHRSCCSCVIPIVSDICIIRNLYHPKFVLSEFFEYPKFRSYYYLLLLFIIIIYYYYLLLLFIIIIYLSLLIIIYISHIIITYYYVLL